MPEDEFPNPDDESAEAWKRRAEFYEQEYRELFRKQERRRGCILAPIFLVLLCLIGLFLEWVGQKAILVVMITCSVGLWIWVWLGERKGRL